MKLLLDLALSITEIGSIWLLIWSWQITLLLAAVWLGLKISRAQSPVFRHQVWFFGLIGVVALPIWSFVVQIFPFPQPTSETLFQAAGLPKAIVSRGPFLLNQSPVSSVETLSAGSASHSFTIWNLVFIGWFGGALVVLGRTAINGLRLRNLRRGAKRTTLADLDCNDDQDTLRSLQHVSILSSDRISSPILLGVLRPAILLPADLTEWTTAAERRAIIQHELAHLTRRDHYTHLFQKLLNLIFYFHPLVIYVCRRLTIEREMACDDRVIDLGTKAETYAESILKVAERCILPGAARQLGVSSTKRILEKRIEMILNKDRGRFVLNHRRQLVLSVTLISALVWMLAPIGSGSAGVIDSERTGRDIYSGQPSFEAALTDEQGEQLKQASTMLAKPYRDAVAVSPNGTFPIKVESSAYGFVKNAFPFSSQLVIKTMQFEQAVTISLTEEQRQLFYQTMRRSISDLRIEPTRNEEDMTAALSKSRHLRLIDNLRNSIKPDAYLFTFVRKMEGGYELGVMAEERNIHRWWGRYIPSLQRSNRTPRILSKSGEQSLFGSSNNRGK